MSKTKVPQNMRELRADLSDLYAEIRNKEVDIDTAQNACRAAGHIISSVKQEITYKKLNMDDQDIAFMNY